MGSGVGIDSHSVTTSKAAESESTLRLREALQHRGPRRGVDSSAPHGLLRLLRPLRIHRHLQRSGPHYFGCTSAASKSQPHSYVSNCIQLCIHNYVSTQLHPEVSRTAQTVSSKP